MTQLSVVFLVSYFMAVELTVLCLFLGFKGRQQVRLFALSNEYVAILKAALFYSLGISALFLGISFFTLAIQFAELTLSLLWPQIKPLL